MNIRQSLLDVGVNAFGVELFAESFLKSPLATAAFEKSKTVRFFLPVRRSDTPGWVGVDIAIAAVDKFDEPGAPKNPLDEPTPANMLLWAETARAGMLDKRKGGDGMIAIRALIDALSIPLPGLVANEGSQP